MTNKKNLKTKIIGDKNKPSYKLYYWIAAILFIIVLVFWYLWLQNSYSISKDQPAGDDGYNVCFEGHQLTEIRDLKLIDGRYTDSLATRWKGGFMSFLPNCAPIRNNWFPLLCEDNRSLKQKYIQFFIQDLNLYTDDPLKQSDTITKMLNKILIETRSGFIITGIELKELPGKIEEKTTHNDIARNSEIKKLLNSKTTDIIAIIPGMRSHSSFRVDDFTVISGGPRLLSEEILLLHEILHNAGPSLLNHKEFDPPDCSLNTFILRENANGNGCRRYLGPEEISMLHGYSSFHPQDTLKFPIPKNDNERCCVSIPQSDYDNAKSFDNIEEYIDPNNSTSPKINLNEIPNNDLWEDLVALKGNKYALNPPFADVLKTNYGTTYDIFYDSSIILKKTYIDQKIKSHLELQKHNIKTLAANKLYQKSLSDPSFSQKTLSEWKALDIDSFNQKFQQAFINTLPPPPPPVVSEFTLFNNNINYTIDTVKYKGQIVSLDQDKLRGVITNNEENPEFELSYRYKGYSFKQISKANDKNNLYLHPCTELNYYFFLPSNIKPTFVEDSDGNSIYNGVILPVSNNRYPLTITEKQNPEDFTFSLSRYFPNPGKFKKKIDPDKTTTTIAEDGSCEIIFSFKFS